MYKRQYNLSVVTSPAGGVTTGSGHYASGANINISASAPQAPTDYVYVFNGWTATAGTVKDNNSENTSFTMPASAAVITANYIQKEDKNNNGVADDEEDKYTVTYTDGVEGEEVFADQVYGNLLSGTAVSYTHLDGYKRQKQRCSMAREAYPSLMIWRAKARSPPAMVSSSPGKRGRPREMCMPVECPWRQITRG